MSGYRVYIVVLMSKGDQTNDSSVILATLNHSKSALQLLLHCRSRACRRTLNQYGSNQNPTIRIVSHYMFSKVTVTPPISDRFVMHLVGPFEFSFQFPATYSSMHRTETGDAAWRTVDCRTLFIILLSRVKPR